MWQIAKKELNLFFSTTIGYATIIVFLVVTGLFTWVFPQTSVFEGAYATLDPFFSICPFLFLFLVPAITMRSFAEERAQRTYELLITKPLTDSRIVIGKYLASVILVSLALIPTILYVVTIYKLGNPVGNLDVGGTIGSYLGLFLLAMSFIAIGIFASTLHDNQIVVFLLAAVMIFVVYVGFSYMSSLPIFANNLDLLVQQLGMDFHYTNMSRGLIDLRDVIYFLSLIALFLGGAWLKLKLRRY